MASKAKRPPMPSDPKPVAPFVPQDGDVVWFKPNKLVFRENGAAIPPEGAQIVLNIYWRRRVLDNDGTLQPIPAAK